MRSKIVIICLITFISAACMDYSSDKFNREVWLKCGDVNDTRNPRSKMIKDLTKNYLKPGMSKDSVIRLLGKPYEDKIEGRLEKGVDVPDSLHTWKYVDKPKAFQDRKLKEFNDWMNAHQQPDTLMLYPVGWSTIDPNFLVIKLNDRGIAYGFWVEQH